MNKKKRIAAWVLAMSMIVTLVAGCGLYSDETTTSPPTTTAAAGGQTTAPAEDDVPELAATWPEFSEPNRVKITWFEQGWTGMDPNLDIITPEIERRTNLYMEYEAMTVPTGDDYTQKLNLMVASDEVPDVFFGGNDSYTRTIYERLGQSGKIWDLTEIIKDYPLIYDLVFPELNLFKTKDNKNYFIPTQTGRGNEVLKEAAHGLSVRKDFLDQLDMDFPTTPEELRTYLQRSINELTVNGEKVNGLILGENLGGLHNLYEPFYPILGLHASYSLPFDYRDNFKVLNYEYAASPELMAAAKYVQSMVADGLLDREILTIKLAQVQEKTSSGLAAAATSPWWDMNTFSDIAKETIPDILYAVTPPIYANEEVKQARQREWTNWVGSWSSIIFSSKIDEEIVRHTLAVMDYMVTDEGQLLTQAGIEGETFFWNDEGNYEFTPEFIEKTNELDWNRSAAHGVFYYSQLVFNIPAIADKQATPPSLLRQDNKIGWDNQQIVRDLYRPEMNPPKDYYFVPGDVENQKFPAIIDAKLEFWAKVVAAGSEAEVEAIVTEWGRTCQNMGIEDIIAERQAYIDNFEMMD